jgi:hypothetical protein
MKIIKLSQSEDTQAWLELRRGKIGGSTAKSVKPLSRGTDKTPAGFWQLLAENLSIEKDGEPERDRGHRLENDALDYLIKAEKLDLDTDPGYWVSDLHPDIAVSPDGAERGDKPTFAAEAKCLDSKNHLKLIVKDRIAKRTNKEYRAFDSLKLDSKINFQDQIVQYFVVNPDLKTVYFCLHDDRIALEHLVNYCIRIERDTIEPEIKAQAEYELEILKEVKSLIKELQNG